MPRWQRGHAAGNSVSSRKILRSCRTRGRRASISETGPSQRWQSYLACSSLPNCFRNCCWRISFQSRLVVDFVFDLVRRWASLIALGFARRYAASIWLAVLEAAARLQLQRAAQHGDHVGVHAALHPRRRPAAAIRTATPASGRRTSATARGRRRTHRTAPTAGPSLAPAPCSRPCPRRRPRSCDARFSRCRSR